jgi:hypothetical protein
MKARDPLLLDAQDVRDILRREIRHLGSQLAWAKKFGVQRSNVNATLSRKRPPSGLLLKALGIEKVVAYKRSEAKNLVRAAPRKERQQKDVEDRC